MNMKVYKLIQDNYTQLHKDYCKYNRDKIVNSCTCEDNLNTKLLAYMEYNPDTPTLEGLILYLTTKQKAIKQIITVEYTESNYTTTRTGKSYEQVSNKQLYQAIILYNKEEPTPVDTLGYKFIKQ